jgi:hypothetical protein
MVGDATSTGGVRARQHARVVRVLQTKQLVGQHQNLQANAPEQALQARCPSFWIGGRRCRSIKLPALPQLIRSGEPAPRSEWVASWARHAQLAPKVPLGCQAQHLARLITELVSKRSSSTPEPQPPRNRGGLCGLGARDSEQAREFAEYSGGHRGVCWRARAFGGTRGTPAARGRSGRARLPLAKWGALRIAMAARPAKALRDDICREQYLYDHAKDPAPRTGAVEALPG